MSPAQARRIALAAHEAAHAVVGTIYGAKIERAALAADSRDGRCDFAADSFGASAFAYRPHIAAAGAVAAAMWHHGPRPTVHQIEEHLHGSDRDELRAAAFSSMHSMSAPLTAVRPIVRRCWSAIVALATDMSFGREIGHADVCTALGLTDDGGPGSVELAMIRSGSAPGSFALTRARV